MNEFQYYRADFCKGRVLTATIMEMIQRKSEFYLKQFKDQPNGVIDGLEIVENNGTLELCAGAVKINGDYYWLDKAIDLSGMIEDSGLSELKDYSLVIRKSESVRSEEMVIIKNASLFFTESPLSDDVVIGMFRYSKGYNFKLYCKTDDPIKKLDSTLDAKTYFSVAVFSNSIKHSQTFPALIFGLMGECLRAKSNKTEFEAALLMQICQSSLLHLDVLELYIERYIGKMTDKTPNGYITGFVNALNKARNMSVDTSEGGGKTQPEPPKNERVWKI